MVKIKFLGHAATYILSEKANIIIDPFLTGNPMASCSIDDVCPSYIIVTHGHGDHLGDAVELSKRNDATIIAPFEVAGYCESQGAKTHAMHIGGGFNFDFGRVMLTKALHGSTIFDGVNSIPGGNPVGILLFLDGKTIYHAGDTGLFGDMQLLGDRYDIDLALLPIGDNFTMGIEDAAFATQMLKAKKVIPIHYDTFPVIKADPHKFTDLVGKNAEVIILKPGEETSI